MTTADTYPTTKGIQTGGQPNNNHQMREGAGIGPCPSNQAGPAPKAGGILPILKTAREGAVQGDGKSVGNAHCQNLFQRQGPTHAGFNRESDEIDDSSSKIETKEVPQTDEKGTSANQEMTIINQDRDSSCPLGPGNRNREDVEMDGQEDGGVRKDEEHAVDKTPP
jgi:hypothetical protein